MAKVIFWEKPGCIGNKKQKAILLASGHELEVRDLLSQNWTAEELRPFFGDKPVADWFNMTNPDVKAGIIKPAEVSEEQALQMMVAEPLLVRRPLLQVGDERVCGFDVDTVNAWIGLEAEALGNEDPQKCPHPAKPCD